MMIDETSQTFYCVNDRVPTESVSLLREACSARGIAFVEINARSFEYESSSQLPRGALLYRPAISTAAIRVEQFLISEGVATFYTDPLGAFFAYSAQWLLFQRNRAPVLLPYVSADLRGYEPITSPIGARCQGLAAPPEMNLSAGSRTRRETKPEPSASGSVRSLADHHSQRRPAAAFRQKRARTPSSVFPPTCHRTSPPPEAW